MRRRRRRLLEAGEHAQRRRLARAGRPDEHHELAVGDVEVERVDGRRVVARIDACRLRRSELQPTAHLLESARERDAGAPGRRSSSSSPSSAAPTIAGAAVGRTTTAWCDLLQPRGDRAEQVAVDVLQHAAAEHDLDGLVGEVEPRQCHARKCHDLRSEPPHDLSRNASSAASASTSGASSITRRCSMPPGVNRFRKLARRRQGRSAQARHARGSCAGHGRPRFAPADETAARPRS
jgi:hypothetical protein